MLESSQSGPGLPEAKTALKSTSGRPPAHKLLSSIKMLESGKSGSRLPEASSPQGVLLLLLLLLLRSHFPSESTKKASASSAAHGQSPIMYNRAACTADPTIMS